MLTPEEEKAIADYELEISISLTPDQVDDALARFYPNMIGNGHPDVCLCHQCAPDEYEYYDYGDEEMPPPAAEQEEEEKTPDNTVWSDEDWPYSYKDHPF